MRCACVARAHHAPPEGKVTSSHRMEIYTHTHTHTHTHTQVHVHASCCSILDVLYSVFSMTTSTFVVLAPAAGWWVVLALSSMWHASGVEAQQQCSGGSFWHLRHGTLLHRHVLSVMRYSLLWMRSLLHTGYYFSGGTCVSCSAGKYQSAPYPHQLTSCFNCAAGTSSSMNAFICNPCSPPSYGPSSGMSSCIQCPANNFCPDSAMSAALPCPSGTCSNAGASSSSFCSPSNCCPAGSYVNNPCTQCPSGKYSSFPNSASCVPCSAGFYATASGATICTACPAGYKCEIASAAPVACKPGEYSASRATSCTSCNLGEYSASPAATSCTSCPAGSACPTTSSSPIPCINTLGEYSLSSAVSCTVCPAGSFCATTSAAPVVCAAGMFAGQGATTCSVCPSGAYCPQASSSPTKCRPGTFQRSTNTTSCTSCPVGQWSPPALASFDLAIGQYKRVSSLRNWTDLFGTTHTVSLVGNLTNVISNSGALLACGYQISITPSVAFSPPPGGIVTFAVTVGSPNWLVLLDTVGRFWCASDRAALSLCSPTTTIMPVMPNDYELTPCFPKDCLLCSIGSLSFLSLFRIRVLSSLHHVIVQLD